MSVVSWRYQALYDLRRSLVSNSAEIKRCSGSSQKLWFRDEVSVVGPGINGKMSEFNAAVGLAQLAEFEELLRKEYLWIIV